MSDDANDNFIWLNGGESYGWNRLSAETVCNQNVKLPKGIANSIGESMDGSIVVPWSELVEEYMGINDARA
jgi:hypothetical protein